MKNWDDSEECGVCKFWQDIGGISSYQGGCHRYPGRPVLVLHFEWCGEFQRYSEEAAARRDEAIERHNKRFDKPPVDAERE